MANLKAEKEGIKKVAAMLGGRNPNQATIEAVSAANFLGYEEFRDAAVGLSFTMKPRERKQEGTSQFQKKGTMPNRGEARTSEKKEPQLVKPGMENTKCYNCGKYGHMGKECPLPDKRKKEKPKVKKEEEERKAAVCLLASQGPAELQALLEEVKEEKEAALKVAAKGEKDFPKGQDKE